MNPDSDSLNVSAKQNLENETPTTSSEGHTSGTGYAPCPFCEVKTKHRHGLWIYTPGQQPVQPDWSFGTKGFTTPDGYSWKIVPVGRITREIDKKYINQLRDALSPSPSTQPQATPREQKQSSVATAQPVDSEQSEETGEAL